METHSSRWIRSINQKTKYRRKIYRSWIVFKSFVFRTKLLNLFSFLWNILFNIQVLKPWPPINLKVLLVKIVLFKSYFFSKNLRCMSWTQRFEEAHESKYGVRPAKKGLWHMCFFVNFANFLRATFLPNISEQLLLEIILNVFKCLAVCFVL